MKKNALVSALFLGLWLSASCSGGGGGDSNGASSSSQIAGVWNLVSVNGAPLPLGEIASWLMTINADKTWTLEVGMTYGASCSMGGTWNETATGVLTVVSTHTDCGGDTLGTETWRYSLSNGYGTLTITAKEGTLVYQRA